MHTTNPLSRLCLVITLIFSFASLAVAQSQAATGNIEGRAVDPNGASVAGTTVTATNQDTGFTKTATTDDEGNYRLILLPPGRYRVTTTATQGFAAATYENVTVTVGGQ